MWKQTIGAATGEGQVIRTVGISIYFGMPRYNVIFMMKLKNFIKNEG